jgi:hypothetical protein
MDTESLRDLARLAYDRELAKQNLEVAMNSRLTVVHNNGVFAVTKEQINFLDLLGSQDVVLLDDHKIPIMVNAHELLAIMFQRYHEVMNEWYYQYNEQAKIRTAKQL